jgi:hypothetical protein
VTSIIDIFIAAHVVRNQCTVITAYTTLERAKTACQDCAVELGHAATLNWKKDTSGGWSSQVGQELRFTIAQRVLDGVEKP